jgi:hypothetical protein
MPVGTESESMILCVKLLVDSGQKVSVWTKLVALQRGYDLKWASHEDRDFVIVLFPIVDPDSQKLQLHLADAYYSYRVPLPHILQLLTPPWNFEDWLPLFLSQICTQLLEFKTFCQMRGKITSASDSMAKHNQSHHAYNLSTALHEPQYCTGPFSPCMSCKLDSISSSLSVSKLVYEQPQELQPDSLKETRPLRMENWHPEGAG